LEFGDRDLKTIQKLRRQFVDETFAATPNDLGLPQRLLRLRRTPSVRQQRPAQLDEAALWLAAGETAKAADTMRRLESNRR
jgi:hypothetical protein